MTRPAAAWENAAMKTRRIHSRPASQGFISAQAAIVLAVIAAGGGGKLGTKIGDRFYAFALPDNN